MITVIYSFNKKGFEADVWHRELAAASTLEVRWVPFNHDSYLPAQEYIRAQLLDNLYYKADPRLARLYSALSDVLSSEKANALLVDTCPPYHPEFLRTVKALKVLRIADGPMAAYDRDFAYLHAYDHIFYHSPAYSRDMDMAEKLRYCGASKIDLWPLALFDAAFDGALSEKELFSLRRDIDIVFVGALHPNKMPLLAAVKKRFGKRFSIYGLSSLKLNLYFNAKFGLPGWVRPLDAAQYVSLYQRAKIGINVHNRGKFTVGSFRLFELPANGVMQISDGGEYLSSFFEPGREVEGYSTVPELIDKLDYYLTHADERLTVAQAGYRRVMNDHRIALRLAEAGRIIERLLAENNRLNLTGRS